MFVIGAALILVVACSPKETAVTAQPPATGAANTTTTTTTVTGAPATALAAVPASAIPVAHTPPGGYGTDQQMPPPVLTTCTEPLPAGVPDLRGMWKTASVEVDGKPAPNHPAMKHVERVEQCGLRLVVTAGGVVHDMVCDGTAANGVHDVAERDFTTPITVVATYENGVHVLRPVGVPVEVTRQRDGQQLVWKYIGFTARLDRVGPPDSPPPAV